MYKKINMPLIDFIDRRHTINYFKKFCTHFIEAFEKFDTSYKKICFINYKKNKSHHKKLLISYFKTLHI